MNLNADPLSKLKRLPVGRKRNINGFSLICMKLSGKCRKTDNGMIWSSNGISILPIDGQ